MGGGGSQSINQTFNMSVMNKSIYESITKNKVTAMASQASIQKQQVVMDNVKGCGIAIGQTIQASASAEAKLNNEQETAIKNGISNEMQAAAQAAISKATEAGNMQFGDKQNVEQKVNMEIQNIVENKLVTENVTETVAEQISLQQQQIVLRNIDCVTDGTRIDITQDITAQLFAKAITNNLQSAIAESETLSKLAADASGSQTSENKGIADIVGTLFEGLTGPIKYAMIACVVCCCLLVLVMIVLGLSPAGQSATANLGKGAAARLGNGRKF